jgi:hypothetical protein
MKDTFQVVYPGLPYIRTPDISIPPFPNPPFLTASVVLIEENSPASVENRTAGLGFDGLYSTPALPENNSPL